MTSKKDLKQRVRERQEKTGERYTTALAHVRAAGADPVQSELHDVSEAAHLEGFTCSAFASDALWRAECALGPPEARFRGVLEHLARLLLASDPPLVELLLRSGGALELGSAVSEQASAREFLTRARAGVRGISPNRRLIVFDVPRGAPVVAAVIAAPFAHARRTPLLWLSELADSPSELFPLAGLGGWSP